MASLYSSTYDPQKDSATSGSEVSDLNPERIYDTDLRRVDPDLRDDLDVNNKQKRVSKFMKAARAAGKYRQSTGISEPSIRGKTPVGKAAISGVELPSLRGRNFGPPGAGSTEYAHKPKPSFGRSF
tara:strand:+ start:1206 stop:1583 length:378 start_codon:yes stop_codon:yes gene_type:complete